MADMTERMNVGKQNGQRAALLTGLTAAGGTGAALVLARRARRRKRSVSERAQAAKATSGRLAKGISSRLEEPDWRSWGLAGLAVAWFLIRMAELRQLRRMARALIASRA